MSAPTVSLFRCAVASLALVMAGRAPAQLAGSSPFLPPQTSGAGAPTAGAPLEYRGFIDTPAGTQYRVYDPARKAGEWIKINEPNSVLNVVAKQYDEARNTLVVEYQGRAYTLAAREAKVVSAGNAAQAMPPPAPVPVPGPGGMAPAVTQSVVVNPSPADEQRRLEAVATEVARRRALREQAAQQMGPGAVPQAAPQTQSQPAQNQPNNQRGRAPNRQPR
ncbi:MAG: hypothetical protein EXS43_11520 [Opitutus sp.]|nr:hypothetical protein [Opitutus sp.]